MCGKRPGLCQSSATWQQSETAAQLNALPENTLIYSNAPGVIYLLSEQHACRIPKAFQATTQQSNTAYQKQISQMQDNLQDGGVIVFFTSLVQNGEADATALAQELQLDIHLQTKEAVIFIVGKTL